MATLSHTATRCKRPGLPGPIETPPAPLSKANWPTLRHCRVASPEASLEHAVRAAEKLLRAYPPGEEPAELERRLERLLNRAFRERRPTKRGKLGAERPALPDRRRGWLRPLPIDRVHEYRIRKSLRFREYQLTAFDYDFMDAMRVMFRLFDIEALPTG